MVASLLVPFRGRAPRTGVVGCRCSSRVLGGRFYGSAPGGLDNPTHPRFTGLATLLRAPFEQDLAKVDLGLVGVPFDGGVTNRPGARYGPREIRNMSQLVRKVNQASKVWPHGLGLQVADVGDAVVTSPYNLIDSHKEIEVKFRELARSDVWTLAVGGDHSVTLPILRALHGEGKGNGKPFGLVHIDAHADTGENYGGSKFHHGAPFSRAVEEGLIDPKRTIQIGIRGSIAEKDQWKFSHDHGMRVIYMEEFYEMVHSPKGMSAITEEVYRVVGRDYPCYLSMDIDALDPCFAPGTGTPEIGGMTTLEAQMLLRSLADLTLVGSDLVEVAPPFDQTGNTAMVGAMMLFEILCVSAQSAARQRGL